MKKIFLLCSFIAVTLFFTSCNEKNDKIDNYDDYIVEIDSKTKVDIEEAYYNEYGYEMKWCNPKEVDGFESIDELGDFRASHSGIRLYGIFDDVYVLCEFGNTYAYGFTVYELCYNDIKVIAYPNCCNFQPPYHKAFIYSKGEINELNTNLSYINDISKDDAFKIKKLNDNYIEHYFYKFLNEDEKQNNDYNSAYNRIYKELTLS